MFSYDYKLIINTSVRKVIFIALMLLFFLLWNPGTEEADNTVCGLRMMINPMWSAHGSCLQIGIWWLVQIGRSKCSLKEEFVRYGQNFGLNQSQNKSSECEKVMMLCQRHLRHCRDVCWSYRIIFHRLVLTNLTLYNIITLSVNETIIYFVQCWWLFVSSAFS